MLSTLRKSASSMPPHMSSSSFSVSTDTMGLVGFGDIAARAVVFMGSASISSAAAQSSSSSFMYDGDGPSFAPPVVIVVGGARLCVPSRSAMRASISASSTSLVAALFEDLEGDNWWVGGDDVA